MKWDWRIPASALSLASRLAGLALLQLLDRSRDLPVRRDFSLSPELDPK